MVKVYYNRIVTLQISFSEVPSNLRPKVLEYAKQQVKEGKLTKEQFEEFFGENR